MSKYIMILLVAFCGCMVTNPIEDEEVPLQNQVAHDQCEDIMTTFCTQANICDPSVEAVAQCSEVKKRACRLNRTELAPVAFDLCQLNQKLTTCENKQLRMVPGAQACVTIYSAWREQDTL